MSQPPFPAGHRSAGYPYVAGSSAPGFFPGPIGPGGGPPHPRTHPWRAPMIALGVVIALVIAVVGALIVVEKNSVSDVGDVAVGNCVRVTDAGDNAVRARKYDCDGAEFTFYVAARSSASVGRCATRDYSRISFDGGGTLCLAPNWRAGHCYEVPRASSRAATYREKGCATVPADADRPIYEVTERTDSSSEPRCADDEEAVTFALPKPVGYCLAIATDMPA